MHPAGTLTPCVRINLKSTLANFDLSLEHQLPEDIDMLEATFPIEHGLQSQSMSAVDLGTLVVNSGPARGQTAWPKLVSTLKSHNDGRYPSPDRLVERLHCGNHTLRDASDLTETPARVTCALHCERPSEREKVNRYFNPAHCQLPKSPPSKNVSSA